MAERWWSAVRSLHVKQARVWCIVCDKETAGRVPRGGDGSAHWPRKHANPRHPELTCDGYYYEASDTPPDSRKDTP